MTDKKTSRKDSMSIKSYQKKEVLHKKEGRRHWRTFGLEAGVEVKGTLSRV